MFSRFFKAKEAQESKPDRAYAKDRWTHKVIYAGTVKECQAYVSAFGDAYVEAY